MKYKVVVEHDPETGHYAATVPGLPIFVDAESEREVRKLVKEAISFYLEEASSGKSAKSPGPVAPFPVKIITVDV
jgi:predicted RNase H-like HicB family nuclease